MRKTICCLLLVLLLFPSCHKGLGRESPLLILSYADNQPEDHPATKAAYYFASLVEEKTDGKVLIEVYADGELGKEDSVYEQMRYGGIDISRVSLGILTDHINELTVLILPFIYRDSEHMWKVLDGEAGDYFLSLTGGGSPVGMAWFDAGARSFYTREQVSSLADLEGLKIRVLETDLMERFFEPLGVVPVRMAYGDIYSSLVKGSIDGAENNMPSYYSMGHYQAARFVYMDEHCRLPELLMISADARDKLENLSPRLYPVILEAAEETALYERKLWKEAEEESLRKAVEAGCVITYPSKQDRDAARELMTAVYDEYNIYSDLLRRIAAE